MTSSLKAYLIALGLLGSFAGGLALGYRWYAPKPNPADTEYRPEVKQADGSIILEKVPSAKVKPKAQIPDGATVERLVTTQIRPTADLVDLEMALIREKDGASRVVLKAEGGEILKAVDLPVVPRKLVFEPKWSVGITYHMPGQTMGVYVDYNKGPLEVGAEVYHERIPLTGDKRLALTLKAGVRF